MEGTLIKVIYPNGQVFTICRTGIELFISHEWTVLTKYLVCRQGFFHKMLLPCLPNQVIDHKNRDYYDLRLSNLRACSYKENMRNRGKFKNSKNTYKGVRYSEDRLRPRPWQARVYVDGRRYTKRFATEQEARKWYDEKVKELHGEFAVPNKED